MTASCKLSKRSPGDYIVAGTRLGIGRLWLLNSDDPWQIYVSIEHMTGDPWCQRNPEVFQTSFSRLRDAREYLEAILASDPLPDALLVTSSGPRGRLRRVRPGEHLVRCAGANGEAWFGELIRRPEVGGGKYWTLYDRQGGAWGTYRSLQEAGERAGHDMARWSSLANWSDPSG